MSSLLPEPSELAPITPQIGPITPQTGTITPQAGPITPQMGFITPQMGPIKAYMGPITPEETVQTGSMQTKLPLESLQAQVPAKQAVLTHPSSNKDLDAACDVACYDPVARSWDVGQLSQCDLHSEESCVGAATLTVSEFADSCPLSPLEWEYHAMMLNEESKSEHYPGMHSDADEFDGYDSGCLGQGKTCVMRLEDCVRCPPCATRTSYSYCALRPGRRHRKSLFKRCWGSIKAKGSACMHPQFSHERYN